MNKICPTCGGDCVLVSDEAHAKVYKCTCCDNVYTVREGQSFPSWSDGSGAARKTSSDGVPSPYATFCGSGASAPTAGGRRAVIGMPAKGGSLPEKIAPGARAESSAKVYDKCVAEPYGKGAERRELSGEEVYSLCINSVTEVRAYRGRTRFSGSGYAISGEYAITNAHVVAEGGVKAGRIEMYACGKTFTATIAALGSDSDGEDLALLKLSGAPAELKSVRFADVNLLKNGQQVFVIGNSLGGGTCITGGIISDKRRMLDGRPRLMTDCAVNRGNSGGPVFNAEGDVVGTIVAVTTSAEGMNYAIPADIVLRFIKNCGVAVKSV